jgi:hypothetical protein
MVQHTTRRECQEARAKDAQRCQSRVLLGYCEDVASGSSAIIRLTTQGLRCLAFPEHTVPHSCPMPPASKISAAHFVQNRQGKQLNWVDTDAMLTLRRLQGAPDVPMLICNSCPLCQEYRDSPDVIASAANAARWYSTSNAAMKEALTW